MTTGRWQYQARAEPLSTAGETPQLDKWSATFPSRLMRKAALTVAIVAGACFLCGPPALAEDTARIDKWGPTYPSRLERRQRPLWQGQSVTDPTPVPPAEIIRVDKWAPQYPSRLVRARRSFWEGVQVVDVLLLTRPETPSPEKWLPVYAGRLDRRNRPFWTGISVLDPTEVAPPAPPTESAHRIFRALLTGPGDLLRHGEGSGATDLFRPGAPPGGKVFR